jgi:signal transduction histidine kinase
MMLKGFICFLLIVFPAINLAAQENEASREIIMVGGNSAYPPYEFLDMDGKPAGFVVELTQAIADAMGFDVRIKLGESWTDMRKALEKGDVDVLEGISYSKARAKILDFSPPHSYVSHSIFAKKDAPPVSSLEELRGKEVILMGRGVMYDYFVQIGFKARPVLVPTVLDAVKLLATGKYDYAVLATLPAMYLIKDAGIKNIKIVAKSIETKKYCYAVEKGHEATLAKFNEGLALLMRTGRYRELQEKWLGGIETQSPAWLWFVKHSVIIVASLFVGLLGSVIWSRTLKLKVAARTVALQHEVEERKRAAEALKLQQQQLVQADKMAALGVLVSGMAHEINNPNGLILLNLPLIIEMYKDIDPILDAHYRAQGDFQMGGLAYSRMRREIPVLLEEMQEAAKRIKRIVDDLKHFSKKSDAELKEQVDLNAVVRTSLRLIDNALKRSAIQCKVHYAPHLPPVKGNSHRLEQVIVNILLNACQAVASSRGETANSTYKPFVDIFTACEDVIETYDWSIFVTTDFDPGSGSVFITVRDKGTGIPPELIPRVTDPFFTTKRDTGGTGLGLAISDEIIREHGGSIRFESMPGEGAIVSIMLPATRMEALL